MENPKCPYCGEEQYLTIEDHREIGRMEYYMCVHCGSRSPVKTTIEEAYAAAMKRERPKGKWIFVDRDEWYADIYKCSLCGSCHMPGDRGEPKDEYCPCCGAEMEANDE